MTRAELGFDPTIHDAVLALAGVCDGAAMLDGTGFNKYDARFGHVLAERPIEQWSFKMADIAYNMIRKYRVQLESYGIVYDDIEPPTKEQVEAAQKKRDEAEDIRRVIGNNGRVLTISLDYRDRDFKMLKEGIKAIPGRRWNPDEKHWTLPMDDEAMSQMLAFAAEHDFDFENGAFDLVKERLENAEKMIVASAAADSDFDVEGIGGTLRPFQRAGIEYAVKAKRTFIADEMGLGKTVEALATIHYLNAYPALVVCPATLKLNWQKEARRWLPGKSTKVLSGTGQDTIEEIRNADEDVVIINYDIITDWQRDEKGNIVEQTEGKTKKKIPAGVLKALMERKFEAVIFDECHALKTGKAQRTEAGDYIAQGKDVILMLSGTPFVNRPVELVSQLRILGRLDDFGGWYQYVRRFCGAYKGRWGWDLSGATNLEELNKKLRSICYIRRKKEDVLKELPEKTRSSIPVEISNRKEYQRAESDLVNWLVEQVEKDEEFMREVAELPVEDRQKAISARKQTKAQKARYAEQLIRLGVLKQLAAKGKLKAAIDWIKDFLENEEKLIVFAEHIEMQRKLLDAFPDSAYIIPDIDHGNVEKRQAQIDRFQTDDGCRLMIASLEGGGLGWTGTSASNVAFLELGWTPAIHNQAEDRTHRIGQKKNVTCWYLIGHDTVDEDVVELIEKKRIVVDAATDGHATEQQSILNDLVRRLLERCRRG